MTAVRKVGAEKIVSAVVGGATREFPADEILLAAGKTPNTQGLDLARAGIETTDRQAVKTSEWYHQSSLLH